MIESSSVSDLIEIKRRLTVPKGYQCQEIQTHEQ